MADLKDIFGDDGLGVGGWADGLLPGTGKSAQYAKSAGTLLGAEEMVVTGASEQVAPKNGDVPDSGRRQAGAAGVYAAELADPAKEYAVPVGYQQDKEFTFYTDEIFFYDDPHELYKHWGPEIWKAVDSHTVINGMNERQVELSLGQVSKSDSKDYGNRMVVFDNMGKPMAVTFEKNKVTGFRAD